MILPWMVGDCRRCCSLPRGRLGAVETSYALDALVIMLPFSLFYYSLFLSLLRGFLSCCIVCYLFLSFYFHLFTFIIIFLFFPWIIKIPEIVHMGLDNACIRKYMYPGRNFSCQPLLAIPAGLDSLKFVFQMLRVYLLAPLVHPTRAG